MSSLSRFADDYTTDRDPRRVSYGIAGFATGLLMIAVAVIIATLPGVTGWGTLGAWEAAGVVGGLGAQLFAVSVYILTPTHRVERPRTRLVVAGTALTLLGVWVFMHVFPEQWVRESTNNSWMVALTYLPGAILTYIAIAHAIIRYKIRTNPGGTISMLFGGPDESQSPSHHSSTPSSNQTANTPPPHRPENPGQSRVPDSIGADMDDAEIVDGGPNQREPQATDPYCGSCKHFEYKKGQGEFVPYCQLMGRRLESMDACEDWTPMADGEEFDHPPQMVTDDYTEVSIDDADDGARRL